MRRLALLVLLAAGAAIAAPSSGGSDYRVDVVFDDSRGLVPGQLVQVAGARVGTIDDVSLTRDFKARVHLEVDRDFAPFREDAQCTIKPQGLIAENYVECDPGSPDAEPLRGRGGERPTVPVEQTTQPVALTDLFEIWNAPTRDRLQILLSSLGIANAGRGADLNAILRRANPALALARRVIGQLERQRDDLATIVDATGEVAEDLGRQPDGLRRLARHAARVTTETARHREQLGESVRRLPALLREARPALRKLDATMDAGRPLLAQLERSAPAVNRLSADIPRLDEIARPALAALAPVLRRGARTASRSGPFLGLVRDYASGSLDNAKTAGVMFKTLEDRGFPRLFIEFLYNGAMAAARYDSSGHILPAHVTISHCGIYSAVPVAGCGSAFRAANESGRDRAEDRDRDEEREGRGRERRTAAPRTARPEPAAPAEPAPAPAQPPPAPPAQPAPAPAQPAPAAPAPPAETPEPEDAVEAGRNIVEDLLDFLLK